MKKAMLLAVCLILAGLLAVNGTFASDFSKTISNVFADLTNKLGEVFDKPEAGGDVIDVALVSDDAHQNLFPGGEVSRSFHVKNQGTGDAYFRLVYAVQYDAESWEHLKVSFTADDNFIEHDWQDITIGSTPYKMKAFTYKNALTSNNASSEVSISIAMDTSVTSEQVARYRSDFLQIQALAIETQSFNEKGYSTAQAALDAALPLASLNPF